MMAVVPVPAIRKAYRALRGGKTQPDSALATQPDLNAGLAPELRAYGVRARIGDAPVDLLLKSYTPGVTNAASNELRRRYDTRNVIAFHDDGTVAVEETASYLADLEQNYPEQELIDVDGRPSKLFPVGTKPFGDMVDEDPLFPGTPLRNGRSVVNYRNWTAIALPQRQFCRMVMEHGQIDVNNKEAVIKLMERAASLDTLSDTYPEIGSEYRLLRMKDELPKLKVQLGHLSGRKQNPFGNKRTY